MIIRGQRRIVTSTAAAFAYVAGRYLLTPTPAAAVANRFDCQGARALELVFGGTGAANQVGQYRLWGGVYGRTTKGIVVDAEINLFAHTGLFTLGTKAGAQAAATTAAEDLMASDAELLADTLTWVIATTATNPKGIGNALETRYLSPMADVYSPADDTIAKVIIPDLCGLDFVVPELILGTVATSVFVIGNLKD